MNALVVDDEIKVVSILKEHMKWHELGIEKVYTAYTAEEARNIVKSSHIDMIICDIEMPQENGLQLLEWMKEQYPEIIKIILTGYPDFQYAQEAINIGVIKYLLKPVSFEELSGAISYAVNQVDEREKNRVVRTQYPDFIGEEKIFYLHLIMEDILPFHDFIKKAADKCGLSFNELTPYAFVYVHLSDMQYKSDSQSIIIYALSNIAEELFPYIVEVHSTNEIYWIVREKRKSIEIQEMCELFQQKTKNIFHGEISTFYTENVTLETMAEKSKVLKQVAAQYRNIGQFVYDVDALLEKMELVGEFDKENSSEQIVEMVKQYLHTYYHNQINRQDIENKFHLNGDYLNRIFKRSTGYSLMQYIQYYRVLIAKKMIIEEKYSITQIGTMVGFDSPSYFTKIFKKWTDITPYDYAKTIEKN